MCKDCGCGLPGDTPVRIGEGHDHGHGHEHSHDHEHPHEHAHGPGEHHGHSHAHPHTHSHVHGTEAHEHDHAHEHGPGMHHGHDHDHPHSHPHAHAQDSDTDKRTTVEVRRAILEKNDRFAERNRGFFQGRGLLVMNVLSSPGSGKTTLLSETAKALNARLKLGVIVGDLATDNDAQRLRAAGMPVVQITTGTVCHLDAEMVAKALQQLELKGLELLVVENVGNLVCPASYDLGEELRVVLLSVTEGEDKPLKYPPMFQSADLVVISKVDLAEACGWNRELAHANIQRVSPKARVLEVSARKGTGMDRWLEFITASHQKRRVTFP